MRQNTDKVTPVHRGGFKSNPGGLGVIPLATHFETFSEGPCIPVLNPFLIRPLTRFFIRGNKGPSATPRETEDAHRDAHRSHMDVPAMDPTPHIQNPPISLWLLFRTDFETGSVVPLEVPSKSHIQVLTEVSKSTL